MKYVNIVDAKEKLAELIDLLGNNPNEEIYLTHNGKPIIKMTPVEKISVENRIGVAKGKFTIPEDFDKWDEEIAEMFLKEQTMTNDSRIAEYDSLNVYKI